MEPENDENPSLVGAQISNNEEEGDPEGEGEYMGEMYGDGEGEGEGEGEMYDEQEEVEDGDELGYHEEGDGEEQEYEEGSNEEYAEGDGEGQEIQDDEEENEEYQGEDVPDQSQTEREGEEMESQNQQDLQLNESKDNSLQEDDENRSRQDDQEDEDPNLPPERTVRYRLLKFINKMRTDRQLPKYSLDLIGNKIAMEYAKYLLSNKESQEEVDKIVKSYNMKGNYKISTLESFIDADHNQLNISYNNFTTDFYDVQATLFEFEQHADNILSEDFNKVGIGMAYGESKVVVVDIFNKDEVTVEACSINYSTGEVVLKGTITNDQYGAYALRIVRNSAPNKTLLQITPQHISSTVLENKLRAFTAVFNNASSVLSEDDLKIVEIYIRVKPESIPYKKAFTDKIRFEDLVLGSRIPLMPFPLEKQLREEQKQDIEDEKIEKRNITMLAEYEKNKQEEKRRRMQSDVGAYGKNEMGEIPEEPSEVSNASDQEEVESKKDSEKEEPQSKEHDESMEMAIARDRNERYENELSNLETTIEELKRDNELIQKKIKIIFEFLKKEGREERNFYKESNINESTYADTLSSTASLYNDLNTHKTKLDQDLKRYQQSIQEQERKKQEVYEILMEYKTELLDNAETRKGTKIPRGQVEEWLRRERELEDDIKELRIKSFTKTLEMNRLKKELKKMEDYFEGLHIIDFEQLKIENNTLTEKIEDRNEEIHKLKNKINYTVQILAHLQEKSKDVSIEKDLKKNENDELKAKIIEMKKKLTNKKEENDKKALKQLNENKKIDQINSGPLKNYYRNTLSHIETLAAQIDRVSEQLTKARNQRRANTKDIKELLQRKDRMMKDYKTLPKIEADPI